MTATRSPGVVCGDELRRNFVRHAGLNGIDHVEVSDDHLTLTVGFLAKAPAGLGPGNVSITGGQQVTGIAATSVRLCADEDPDIDDCIQVTVNRPGDASCYRLCLVQADALGRPTAVPLPGIDPRYACIEFSFMAGCPTALDCAASQVCPPETFDEPPVSYLAKDYASFRQLLLDRLSLIMPEWTETHVPDVGIALVELLSWVGDELSYYQDAVATEAYLQTARLRISVRRHATLVDYRMHDGCNARAWVSVELSQGSAPLTLTAGDVAFITSAGTTDPLNGPALLRSDLAAVDPSSYEVFEPVIAADVVLYPANSTMYFWSWGNSNCCLPAGTTAVTLVDAWVGPAPGAGEGDSSDATAARERGLHLAPGDVVIIEEICGPITGAPADADPTNRQAVRLTSVQPAIDELFDQPIVNVTWSEEDALTFPACVSSLSLPDCDPVCPVTVVRGNIVLVDHGATITACGAPPEQMTVPWVDPVPCGCLGPHRPGSSTSALPVYEPVLAQSPVTQREPFPDSVALAHRQALVIEAIPSAALADVRGLLPAARAGDQLSSGAIASLTIIFGVSALVDVNLIAPVGRPGSVGPKYDQADAIEALLGDQETLLDLKLRRIATLARRARAGEVLGPAVSAEIEASWGAAYAAGLDPSQPSLFGPAASGLVQDPRDALPQVTVTLAAGGAEPEAADAADLPWVPKRTLFFSSSTDRDFVGEVDDNGAMHLRFGDGTLGEPPPAGATLGASYRVGNGTAGMVGAETIAAVVSCTTRFTTITNVSNPLPAAGGVDPEPVDVVKRNAPARSAWPLLRAVTAADYAAIASAQSGLQRAAAELRWTGSWYEADVALDPLGTETLNRHERAIVRDALTRVRRIGHDLRIESAEYVPLDVAMRICVLPDFQRAHVEATLLAVFDTVVHTNGQRGFFNPDSLTFGGSISASTLIAAAAAVTGVESAVVTRLRRLGEADDGELAAGVLTVGPMQIPQLDNDPRHPERGVLAFTLGGGR